MAEVYDRWHRSRPKVGAAECGEHRGKVPTADHGIGKRWQVRYRDLEGKQRKENFEKRAGADARAAAVEDGLNRGAYVDPGAGKTTLRDFAADWLASRTSDPSTIEVLDRHLRLHILPALGSRPLRTIRPSTVQSWRAGLTASCLGTNYANGILVTLSTILGAAVDDGELTKNPCHAKSVKAPKAEQRKIVPWTVERAAAVIKALPDRYACMGILGAGCGLRQGEILGLGPDDIDFLRGIVHVRRQVKHVKYRRVFAPPKGGKIRDVPLPPKVAAALSAHLKLFPARLVTLSWRTPDGEPTTAKLFFTTPQSGAAVDSNSFNSRV